MVSTPQRAAIWAFLSLFFVGGILMTLMFISTARQDARVGKEWRRETCRILRSELREVADTDSEGRSSTRYEEDILYSYEIDGIEYKSSRVALLIVKNGATSAQALVARFAEGTTHTCWVDPADRHSSVLLHGTGSMAMALIPFCFALIGAIGVFDMLRFAWAKLRGRVPPPLSA